MVRRRTGAVSAGLAAVLTATTLASCSGSSKAPASTIGASGGTGSGLAGSVRVTVPKGAVQGIARLGFAGVKPTAFPASAYRLDPFANALAIADINVAGGSIAGGQARVTMKLPAGLPEPAARDVYIAVYEPELKAFVHLPSTVNLARGEVTAVAPHFSTYGDFIDTAKQAGHQALKVGQILALGPLGFIPAVRKFVEGIQKTAFDAVFAKAPKLKCDPASTTAKAFEQDGTNGRLFKVCAESIRSQPGDTRLEMSNGFAFPILLLPRHDVGVGLDDLPDDPTLLDLLRHIFWMQFNKEEVVGDKLARLTVSPKATLPIQFNGYLDWGAVAADIAFVLATDVFLPEAKVTDPVLKPVLADVVKAVGEKIGPDAYEAAVPALKAAVTTAGKVGEDIDPVLGVALCVTDAVGGSVALQRDNKLTDLPADLKLTMSLEGTCLLDRLAGMADDVTQMAEGIASDLKIIPEAGEAQAAAALRLLGINVTQVTVGLSPVAPPLADGTYYGYLRSFDTHFRALRFARVEFADSPDKAQQLCEQNGVPVPPEGELCHDYYLKDDKVVADSTASKSVRITDWHKFNDYTSPPVQGNPYQFSLKQFAQTVGSISGRTELFQFTVHGGQIVAINGIYLP
jgi:hypothetical protein